jgi:DNA mismatch endonuclease, patch repair protein
MSKVRTVNTAPELLVRRALHRLGYRYVLHDRRLPGTPDIVFPSRHKVVLVHGCFWHQHSRCPKAKLPTTRPEFWVEKLQKNRVRDRHAKRALEKLGWKVHVVWECELKNLEVAIAKLVKFLA